jgi:hypothetical protein
MDATHQEVAADRTGKSDVTGKPFAFEDIVVHPELRQVIEKFVS